MSNSVDLREMLEAGVHFGHKKDRWNPKMRPFIYTERNGVHIFDLTITKKKLEEAMSFVSKVTADHGTVLFVGTKNQVKEVVKNAAKEAGMPYLVDRWPGGMLTNFQTIVERLKYLEEAEAKNKDEKSSLTKKEKLSLSRELEKLKATFEGVVDMRRLPDAIFVSDICKERIAVKEAHKVGISVIGIADSNAIPDIDFVVPGNDDAVKSVSYIFNKIAAAVQKPKSTDLPDKTEKVEIQKVNIKKESKIESKAEEVKK